MSKRGKRTVAENVRTETETRQESRRQEVVRLGVESVFDHLTADEYRSAAAVLTDRLLPALEIDLDSLHAVSTVMDDSEYQWMGDSVELLLRESDKIIRAAPEHGDTLSEHPERDVSLASRRLESPQRVAERVVTEAAESAHSAAIAQGIIDAELNNTATVTGLSNQQVGVQHVQWDMSVPDPVSMSRRDRDHPFLVAVGDTSSGKSTAVATLVMDRYEAGHKIIDIHDRKKLENGVYDLSQRQDDLREVRQEMGLSPGFDDDTNVDVEIRVPLSESLSDAKVPYTDDGECTVKPFQVNPSSLNQSVLTALAGDLTKKQSEEWQRAMDSLSGEWSLGDLREEIMEGPADDGVIRGLTTRIQTLEQKAWIASDSDSDYLLDWHSIFGDTDTITSFSASLMDNERDKYRVLLYLLSSVYRRREERQDLQYDSASLVMRELHHIAPVSTNRAEDPVKQRIQKQIASQMRSVAAESGHENLELITDTQHWGQVAKRVRQHVNQVLMFRLSHGPADRVFEDVLGGASSKYVERVTRQSTGVCTIVADNQRLSGDGESFNFLQPVQFSPPSCHHVDRESDISTGWAARREYADEKLDAVPDEWPVEAESVASPDVSEGDDVDPDVMEFAEVCLEQDDDGRVAKDDLLLAFREFTDRDAIEKRELGEELSKALPEATGGAKVKCRNSDLIRDRDQYSSSRPYAVEGVTMSDRGVSCLRDRADKHA